MPDEGFTVYLLAWWLNQIAQPVAIISGVIIWTWDRLRKK